LTCFRKPTGIEQGSDKQIREISSRTKTLLIYHRPETFVYQKTGELMPQMTVNLAAFNVITTLYLIVGSLHEEKRFAETYGQAYIDYQTSQINFLVFSLTHSIRSNHKITG
jgi:hypothetical protein